MAATLEHCVPLLLAVSFIGIRGQYIDRACTGDYLGKTSCPLGRLISVTRIYIGQTTNPSLTDLCSVNETDCTQDVVGDRYQYLQSHCNDHIVCNNAVVGPALLKCGQQNTAADYLVVEFKCRQSSELEFWSLTPLGDVISPESCPVDYVINIKQMFYTKSEADDFQCLLNITEVNYLDYLQITNACNNSQLCNKNIPAKSVTNDTCGGDTTHVLLIYTCVPKPKVVQRCLGDAFDNETLCPTDGSYYIKVLSAFIGNLVNSNVSLEDCRVPVNETCLRDIIIYLPDYYQQILDSCNGKTSCTNLTVDRGLYSYCIPGTWTQFIRIYYECVFDIKYTNTSTTTTTRPTTTTTRLPPPTTTTTRRTTMVAAGCKGNQSDFNAFIAWSLLLCLLGFK